MRTLSIVCLMLLAGACSSHHVLCNGPLQPINAPAAVQKPPSQTAASKPVDQPAGRKP